MAQYVLATIGNNNSSSSQYSKVSRLGKLQKNRTLTLQGGFMVLELFFILFFEFSKHLYL